MKKRLLLTLSSFTLLCLSLGVVAPTVSAADPASCNGTPTSIDFKCSDYDTDGISAILMYVINIMGIGVGIAVVIGIVLGGIKYAGSDGDEGQAKEGREIITNSIIGLFLFIFLYAGTQFLIPGGIFNLNKKPVAVASSSSSGSSGSSSSGSSNSSSSGSSGSSGTVSGSGTSEKLTALKTLQGYGTIGNLRDAGASGYIKTGVLYRSANLNGATAKDKVQLAILLKNGAIIDLRKSSDNGYKSDPVVTGVANIHHEIEGAASAQGYKTDFINSSVNRQRIGQAITSIANEDGPVLMHCKAGKDRTGWIVALVMMAIGVSKDNALKEYLKSPSVSASWYNAAYAEAVTAAHSSNGTILGFITGSVSNGGLGVSTASVAKLKAKLQL